MEAHDKPWVHWRCPRPHHGPRSGHRNEKTVHGGVVLNFFSGAMADVLRLTTTRPARQRWAAAESRSFERCVPTTSCRDRAPASSIPLRAHGPPAARICTSATAMRTRCGEGDLVGGWHAGASPFTPITRWVTNRGSSSASLAHTYTPLGRSQRL